MNKIDLHSKSAVITGCARGIGLAITQRLLESGARCSIWDVDSGALNSAQKQLQEAGREKCHGTTVDVGDAKSVSAAAAATLREFGPVDILVNNAGIAGATKKLWELTPEEWHHVLMIDLFGVFLCCRALV